MARLKLKSRHRLVCGSCTDKKTVEQVLLQGNKAQVCLTDPPYGIGDTASSKNDYRTYDDTSENLEKLISEFFPIARALSKNVAITPGVGNIFRYPKPDWIMAWFTPAGVGSGPWGFCCWQPILCFGKDPKLARRKGRHPDAIVHTESAESNGHPCPKPVNFWKWMVERVSEVGDIVFDPFSGSGTTIIAAEMTGRLARTIEIDPAYVDIALRRWVAFTGSEPVRESSERTFSEIACGETND